MINNGGSDAHTVCGARLNEHLESALREAQADPVRHNVLFSNGILNLRLDRETPKC